jgi:tellurite resistance protein
MSVMPMSGPRLQYLPVTLFSSVMGLAGLSLAWRRAAKVWGDVPTWPATSLFWVAAAVFVVIATLYTGKWIRHPGAAWAELQHPIRMAFAPTMTIALLLLATAGATVAPDAARIAWWIGAPTHLAVTVAVLSAWFARPDIHMAHVTPAWFIPIVGNVVTPLGARENGSLDLAWFAFGVGFTFWIALLPLLLQRVLTHEQPLPEKLLPTLAIFIAPPAVAMLSWQALTGETDGPMVRILHAAAMMFVVLLFAQVARLRRVPFALPYWAYTFPLAGASAAATAMAGSRPGWLYDAIAIGLLGTTTVLVGFVAPLTLRAAIRGEICVPE